MARVQLREKFPDYVLAHFSKLSQIKYNFENHRFNPENIALVLSESDPPGELLGFLRKKGYLGPAIFIRKSQLPERATPSYDGFVKRNLSKIIDLTGEHLPN